GVGPGVRAAGLLRLLRLREAAPEPRDWPGLGQAGPPLAARALRRTDHPEGVHHGPQRGRPRPGHDADSGLSRRRAPGRVALPRLARPALTRRRIRGARAPPARIRPPAAARFRRVAG